MFKLNTQLCLISDTFRFQEESPCKAAPHNPESEEEYDQEDEVSDRMSVLSVESTGEAEGMPLSVVSGSGQCKNNSFNTHLSAC